MRYQYRSATLLLQLLLGCTALLACVEDDPVDARATPPQWTVASLPDDSIADHPEMVAIAKEVPEFGGYYFDPSGELVVALTDLSKRAAVEGRIRSRLRMHRTAAGFADGASARVRTKTVRYSFLELARYRTALRRSVLGARGVVSLDLNEVENRIDIGILAGVGEAQKIRELVLKLGIPGETVSIHYEPQAVENSHGIRDPHPQGLIEGGWRIRSSGDQYCTLGFAARRASNGAPVFITNSHCTNVHHSGTPDGTEMSQGAHFFGTEILDPWGFECTFFDDMYGYPFHGTCRHSDSAMFSAAQPLSFGHIARTTGSSNCEECISPYTIDHANPTIPITGTESTIVMYEILHKMGDSTGWSYGLVMNTCKDIVRYPPGGNWAVVCNDVVDYVSRDGDSGAPVFTMLPNNTARLRGINWGHLPFPYNDGIMSNLAQVVKDMGQFTVYDSGPPQVAIQGPTEVPQGAWCQWEAQVSGGIPPYTYQWSGLFSGTGTSVNGAVMSSGTLQLAVTDFFNRTVNSSKNVSIQQGLPPLCE